MGGGIAWLVFVKDPSDPEERFAELTPVEKTISEETGAPVLRSSADAEAFIRTYLVELESR